MRVVDFLSLILKTHGAVLEGLSAFFPEDVLVELLEFVAEKHENIPNTAQLPKGVRVRPSSQAPSQPYDFLEGEVRALNLKPILEFYLWSYPFYRQWIESDLPVTHDLIFHESANSSESPTDLLLKQCIEFAESWGESLNLPEPYRTHFQKMLNKEWTRFRSEYLRLAGKPVFAVLPGASPEN